MTVYQPKHLMSQYRLGLFRVAKGILAPGLAVGFGLEMIPAASRPRASGITLDRLSPLKRWAMNPADQTLNTMDLEAVVEECGEPILAQAVPRAAKAGGCHINVDFALRPDPWRKIQRSLIRSRSAHEGKDRWNSVPQQSSVSTAAAELWSLGDLRSPHEPYQQCRRQRKRTHSWLAGDCPGRS